MKLALPKGPLMASTSRLLSASGLGLDGYNSDSRLYHLKSIIHRKFTAKIFQEKDIPIQVSIGNYDIGICGLDWIEELMIKFPDSPIIKLSDLEYDSGQLYLCSSKDSKIADINYLLNIQGNWRFVSEYPNLCEHLAGELRLRRFRIFPVWGAADIYPPDDADIILTRANDDKELSGRRLISLKPVMKSSAYLIVNKRSWQTKNLSRIIQSIINAHKNQNIKSLAAAKRKIKYRIDKYEKPEINSIKLALPDGHQMKPASELLKKSSINISGYSESDLSSRPGSNYDWLKIKVIRPQDMPIQVANENFDLAITGIDWLKDHLWRFPSSPVQKLLELGFGGVKIVAVINNEVPADSIDDLKYLMGQGKYTPLRVATEYTNIADIYLHNNHVKMYKVIPTWGATEALIPEDADMLIENTQTGKTLAAHNLKIIDTLFYSTACLICNKNSLKNKIKNEYIMNIKEELTKIIEG
jgi:ATP phosphoribosyltransferase